MSVYVGPGEGVEEEGCRPSIYISIDICTGTWVYFSPYFDIAYSYLVPLCFSLIPCIYLYKHIYPYVLQTNSMYLFRYVCIPSM